MGTFTSDVTVDHPLADVFAWHEQPGALVRLCPPWNSSVVSGPSDGLRPGSTATLRLAVPGTFGSAGLTWVARHVDYEPPTHFSDIMAQGPLKSWRHDHSFAASVGGKSTRLIDRIDYETPLATKGPQNSVIRRMLTGNFAYRGRQLRDDLSFHAAHDGPRRCIAIAGASGMVGTQLAALLSTGGHDVRRIVRHLAQEPNEITWDPVNARIDRAAMRDVEVVIHLGGRSIGGRFNKANKRAMIDSRVRSTSLLASTLAGLSGDGGPDTFICASAIGYYGADRSGELLSEHEDSGDGFLAELCRGWERATKPASDAGIRVVNIRTGIVQSPVGGALAKVLPLFRLGVGGPMGNGRQWQSWISIDDIAGVFAHAALSSQLEGPLNAVAPEPVTGKTYAKTLGRVLRRPALVPVPSFGPMLLLGREGAHELALASQRVDSSRLIESGYTFRHPTLEVALRHILGRVGN